MQLFTLANNVRLLVVENPNTWLTNGEAFSQTAYLGINEDPGNWTVATQEEYEAAMAEKEEAMKKKMESSTEV